MKKRFLSILLMLAMVVTMLPFAVGAEPVVASEEALTADDLYVTDDLAFWVDGTYGVDIAKGKWYNKVDDGATYATLVNPSGISMWKAVDGGISYTLSSFTQMKNWKQSIGIHFPTELMTEGDMTVEYVMAPTGGIDKNGNSIKQPNSDSATWGVYNGGKSAFSFGGLHIMQFTLSEKSSGSSGQSRVFYSNNSWDNNNFPNLGGAVAYTGAYIFSSKDVILTDVMSLTFVRDVRDGVGYFDLVKNGIGVYSFKTTGNQQPVQSTLHSIETLNKTGSSTAWSGFFGVPATVYNVRMYTRALTQAERNQNHFADLAKYYNLDLTAVAAMDDSLRELLFTMTSTMSFTVGAEVVMDTIASIEEMMQIVADNTTVYDKLYVQDGLVMLTDAFTKNDTINLTSGMWYNLKDITKSPMMVGSSAELAWVARENGGVGYDMTAAQVSTAGKNMYLDLGNNVVDPDADFTVEFAGTFHGVWNGTGYENTDSYCADAVTMRLGAWGIWRCNKDQGYRIIYNATGKDGNYGHGAGCYAWKGEQLVTASPVSFSTVVTNNGTSAVRTMYFNAANAKTYTTGVKDVQGNTINVIKGQNIFYIMRDVATTVYSVRVYDRALSTAEVKWNSFVDVAAYFKMDLDACLDMSASIKASLAASLPALTFNSDANAIANAQKIVDQYAEVAAGMSDAVAAFNDYDALYVQDGMTLLMSAFEADASVRTDLGVWYNKLGDNVATMIQGGAETNAKYGWKADKGVTYRIATPTDFWKEAKGSTGLVLPADALNNGDFTVEFVFDPHGLSGEDGVVVPHDGTNGQSQWGAYTSNRSAFAIAGLQMCMFHKSSLGTGNTMRMRTFYLQDAWETPSSSSGKLVHNMKDHVDMFGVNNGSYDWKDGVMTMSIDRTVAPGQEYTLSKFAGSVAGYDFTVDNGEGVKDGKNSKNFYAVESLTRPFEAFVGFPATVYAIRVYDRVLTAEEKAQNHFADIAAFYGVDVSRFNLLSDSMKANIYAMCAEATFENMTTEALQYKLDTIIAGSTAAVVGPGAYEVIFADAETSADLVLYGMFGVYAENLEELIALGCTVEFGAVIAPVAEGTTVVDITVTRGENAFTTAAEYAKVVVACSTAAESVYVTMDEEELLVVDGGVVFTADYSYIEDLANGEIARNCPLAYRAFVSVTEADGTTTIYYTDAEYEIDLVEIADYYVNQYGADCSDKLEVYAYNQHSVLLEILGDEAEIVEIELAPTMGDKVTDESTVYAGDITEATMEAVRETVRDDAIIEDANGEAAEDNVASQEVIKVRPVDDTTVAYTFTTEADGNVRVVIEYVARKYTLGNRTLTVQIDGYKAEVYEFTSADAATDVNNHAFLVIEFEVAAGEHTITLGAVEGTRSVDIYGVAVTEN